MEVEIRKPNTMPRNTASSKNAVATAFVILAEYSETGGKRIVW